MLELLELGLQLSHLLQPCIHECSGPKCNRTGRVLMNNPTIDSTFSIGAERPEIVTQFTAVAVQEQAPRRLHDRIERHFPSASERLQL